jgi:uncharacterized protein YggE
MNGNSLTIAQPFGISVFGSALLRVSPDSATIRAAITRLEEKPSEAFTKARKGAQGVTGFLRKAQVKESGLSRISVSRQYRLVDNERRAVGYLAKIGITVILSELDRIEEIVSGLVDVGANEITAMEFQTSKLKELRAHARELATHAAREKAETYAAAGKVSLGEVLHIQDVNPKVLEQVWHSQFTGGPIQHEMADIEPEHGLLDPSAIEVGAAVLVAYRIAGEQSSRT